MILNVFQNYVPNKYITIDDKDPVWMIKITKSKLEKNKLHQQYIQNRSFEGNLVLNESSIAELNDSISYTQDLYYGNHAKNEMTHC